MELFPICHLQYMQNMYNCYDILFRKHYYLISISLFLYLLFIFHKMTTFISWSEVVNT